MSAKALDTKQDDRVWSLRPTGWKEKADSYKFPSDPHVRTNMETNK